MRHTPRDLEGIGHGQPIGGHGSEGMDMAGEGSGGIGRTFAPFDEGWDGMSLDDIPDMTASDAPDMRDDDFPPMRDEDFPPMRDEDFPPMDGEGFEPMSEDDLIWSDDGWPSIDDEA